MVQSRQYHAEDGELVKMAIAPRPYQERLPIFQMVESIDSMARCAQRGIGTMTQSASAGRLLENWTRYREVATETHGREFNLGEGLAVMRPCYVAETQEQAERDTREGYNLLGQWGSTSVFKDWLGTVTEDEVEPGDENLDFYGFQIKHGQLLIGSPENVSEQIERLRSEANCQHIALFLNIPLLSYEQVNRSLRLFADEVMPQFVGGEEQIAAGVSAGA